MDGCIADFHSHFNVCFKHHYPNHTPMDFINELKKEVSSYPNWWDTIPPMEDSNILINFLKKHNFEILTAYAEWDKRSIKAKPKWCWKHFGICPARVNVVLRKEKALFAKDSNGRPNILIDDYEKNIKEFNDAGGIGILHRNANSTIAKLQKHL